MSGRRRKRWSGNSRSRNGAGVTEIGLQSQHIEVIMKVLDYLYVLSSMALHSIHAIKST